jgi:hypothetical protein
MHSLHVGVPALLVLFLGCARPALAQEGEQGACLADKQLVTAQQFLDEVQRAQQYLQGLDTPVMERSWTMAERSVALRVPARKGRNAKRTGARKERLVELARRITIAAYDECDGMLHAVVVRVPHPLPVHRGAGGRAGPPTFVFTNLTPEFDVSHEGGMGVARLKFSVSKNGRALTVLAMRHPLIASRYWHSRDPRLADDVKTVVYSAYQPGYHGRPFTEGLVAAGVHRWLAGIHSALDTLNENGARSFAFPDERLAKLWLPEVLLMLGTIEQSDDSDFRGDPKRTTEAVAIEYALNREPFYYANSSAGAIGPYQFTDRWKGSRPGTYSTVVRKCADAQLAPSFEHAARDLKNSLQAAVCLLDLELARMPEDALRLFREDYRLGAVYPVAAYNAGGGQSARLYEELPPEALPDAARSLDLPLNAFRFRRVVAHRKKHARMHAVVIVNNETRTYLLKMFTTWGIVDDWMARGDDSAAAKPVSEESGQ